MLRYLTAGESHGPALTAIIEGMPSGIALNAEYINKQLARRQGGYGRGARMKIENDQVHFLSGVRGGQTLGSPITLQVTNEDWDNWSAVMSPEQGARLDERVVTRPRPGHADLAGAIKYGHRDIRNVLERSSARETAARVAVGSVARRLIDELRIQVAGRVIRIGSVEAGSDIDWRSVEELTGALAGSQLLCSDPEAEKRMINAIDQARESGDTLGGIFQIRVYGVPAGLGSYVQWDRKLDGRLAAALMSIQAVKGVEIGLGFKAARQAGSLVQDEIFYEHKRGFFRRTNNAGGLEGGVTNGEVVVINAAMKPIPTLYQPLQSVDLITKEPMSASIERSDICAVPAACVIGEAVVAWELARACLEKCGGDTLAELKDNWEKYLLYLRQV
ncbi:MAG: Chorismate synthase [Pelotomaculum sp. PtaB.Bin104]|nr:MAG: Chorismate synthase [Pelotomaculum sp. PtaB.Bin104]